MMHILKSLHKLKKPQKYIEQILMNILQSKTCVTKGV